MSVLTSPQQSSTWPELVNGLLRQQPYRSGSIDRALLDSQTLLASETRPALYGIPPVAPAAPAHRPPKLEEVVAGVSAAQPQALGRMVALTAWCSRIPLDFPLAEASTAAGYYGDFSSFSWGGDEETVIAKGSPWPQEIARVLASLLQLAGFASRLVFLYRADPPGLHTVVEAWALGSWAVCDACANRCYLWPHHGYASARILQQQPALVDRMPEHGRNPYVDSAFYRTVGIAAYALTKRPRGQDCLQPAHREDLPLLQRAAEVFSPR